MKSLDRLVPNLELLDSLTEKRVSIRLNNKKKGSVAFSVAREFGLIPNGMDEIVIMKTAVALTPTITIGTEATEFTPTTVVVTTVTVMTN